MLAAKRGGLHWKTSASRTGKSNRSGDVVVKARYRVVDTPLQVPALDSPSAVSATPAAPVEVPPAEPILASPAAPEVAGITVQEAKDVSMEDIPTQPATESVLDFTSNLTDSVSDLTDTLAGSVTDSVSGIAGSVTGSVAGMADSVTGSVSDITKALDDSVSGLTTGLAGSVSEITDSVTGLTQQVGESVTGSVSAAAAQASQTFQAASGAIDGTVSAVAGTAASVVDSVTGTLDALTSEAVQSYNNITSTVTSTVAGTVQSVEDTISTTGAAIWSSLPPDAQGVLLQAGEAASAAAGFAAEYPAVSAGIVGVGTAAAVAATFQDRFAGYAGELSPEAVLDLLNGSEPALLLDIRPDVVRQKEGLAELKLGARFKAVALPFAFAQDQVAAMDGRVLRNLACSRDDLVLAVQAAFVANLKQVSTPLTKVVVVDREGSAKARELARAMRREGLYSSYVMAGGFVAWAKAGLPVTTERGITYEASAADLISDNVEVVVGRALELATRLKDPAVAVPVAGTTVLGAAALYYYHITLELIGIGGLSWSLYSELSKYDSPQAAVAAWGAALSKLASASPAKRLAANSQGKGSSSSKAPSPADKAAQQQAAAAAAAVIASMPPGVVAPKLPPPPGLSKPEDVLARVAQAREAQASQTTKVKTTSASSNGSGSSSGSNGSASSSVATAEPQAKAVADAKTATVAEMQP